MATVGDIIALALRDSGVIGVGQTALAQDTNDAFTRVNYMLSQWQRKRWLIWHLVDVACVSTGAQSYNIGPGQSFNVMRPDRLESAFLRQIVQSQPNQIDYPVVILESREDYNRIGLKQLQSFERYIFYDSAYPIGIIYPWPVPQASIYEMHVSLKEQLGPFTGLTQVVNIPPEYQPAIHYNLCARLRPAYQLPPDPTITQLALESLSVIRGANAQIPQLVMPRELIRPGIYDVYSDRIY